MTTPRSRLPLLLVAALLMAPELGDCGRCDLPPLPSSQPAWTLHDASAFDAGFSGATERAARVRVLVVQPPGDSTDYEVRLTMKTSAPDVVTPDCGWDSWNLCFEASKGRPTTKTDPPQYAGNLDYLSCPALTRPAVDGFHFKAFASLSTSVPSTAGCTEPYSCTIDGVQACKGRLLTLTRTTSGPDFPCDRDAGVCTSSLDVTVTLDDPGTPKVAWTHGDDGGWTLQPLTDAALMSHVSFEASLDGPIVHLPCSGCVFPHTPEGLALKLEVTPLR